MKCSIYDCNAFSLATMPASGYVPVAQYEDAGRRQRGLLTRGVLLMFAVAVAIFGCIAIAVTIPITLTMRTTHVQHIHPTPGDLPTPVIVVPTHHMHPHLNCIYSQTELACMEAARRHGKPGLALPWVHACPHDNHVLVNTTGENTDTSKCLNTTQLPNGCVFWTSNTSLRSGYTFVSDGTASCGETITLPHENISHTLYCVPTCHIPAIVVTTTSPPTTTTEVSTTTLPQTTSEPAQTTSTTPETTSEAAQTTTFAPVETSNFTHTSAPATITSTAPETTSTPATTTSEPAQTTSTAPETTSAPAATTVPPETSPPDPVVTFGSCRLSDQKYCIKNKTTTTGDVVEHEIVDCDCEECAETTGCRCGSFQGHYHPGPLPSKCIGSSATNPCMLDNMTLTCETILGQRYLTDQYVCGDGTSSSRHGKVIHYSCPRICLTKAQVQFFEPTFNGDCSPADCCGNWRMIPKVDAETGLVNQCRAPNVGTGNHSNVVWSDTFSVGLPQAEPCRATCGNKSSSTQCTDFRTSDKCGNYVTSPGFTYVELPGDTQPGCTKALPEGTVCENNVVYDIYPTGRCIRGCEIMANGHCLSLVTEQHPDIPKDSTYTESATFNGTFWDAVTKNESFIVNISYGPLCPVNTICSNLPVIGSTTCQPLTCCNTCGERSKKYLSQKKIAPWVCSHIKAPCEYYWPDGDGYDYPPLSCEDSVSNSTVVDREQLMGTNCNGACDTNMGDSCAEDGYCVQHEPTGERSRCSMLEPYSLVYAATVSQSDILNAVHSDYTVWMFIDGQPRGFVCSTQSNDIYIVPYPFSVETLPSTVNASFERHSKVIERGRVVFQNEPGTIISSAQNIVLTLSQKNSSGCIPPAYTCDSHSITFGFSNLVALPQQYTFALNGTVPATILNCSLCYTTTDFAVADCTSVPTLGMHENITAISSKGCEALSPCDISNCNYKCLHEDNVSAYKGSLRSCDPTAGICQGLDGDLGSVYPCLLTPKQNNWAFYNRASSCSIGLWGSVICTDNNAIPSLDGAYCICKGGYELKNSVCTACLTGQNSNPGGECLYVYPTGTMRNLELVDNTAKYIKDPVQRIAGQTLIGGNPNNKLKHPLNMTIINNQFQQVFDNAHSPTLSIGQGSETVGTVCSVNTDTKKICIDIWSSGWSGVSTWISTQGSYSMGTSVGTASSTSGGCPNTDNFALYCRTPDSINLCQPGQFIYIHHYYVPPIPCNSTYQYVVLTQMVSLHNTPGIGCHYVILKVDWIGDKKMEASIVEYDCYGNAWAVGDTVVSMASSYPGVNWQVDLKVTAINNQQPVFIPIKP